MDWSKQRRQRLVTVCRKALAFHSQPTEETFPELPEVLVWFRFVLAVTYGLYLGWSGVRSSIYILQALNLITFVPVLYCRLYLGMNDFTGASSSSSSSFGSQIVFAGTVNALALTLLLWIYFFTAQHDDDERTLTSLLVTAVSNENDAATTTIHMDRLVGASEYRGDRAREVGSAMVTPKGGAVVDDPEF